MATELVPVLEPAELEALLAVPNLRDVSGRWLRSKKSSVGRVVYAATATLEALLKYREDRSAIISPTDFFFVTSKGTGIAPAFVSQMMAIRCADRPA